jgi:uncharacterized membrane protein (DUF2068 family)
MTGAARGDRIVSIIGAFKLIKAALLVSLGVAALLGVPEEIVRSGFQGVGWTGALAAHHTIHDALVRWSVDGHELRDVGIACLIYAAVFIVEGVGLLRRRRWAEWLTVIVTGSFIPFEIYELGRRPRAGQTAKLIALALNVAIVAYLAWRRARARVPRRSRLRAA